MQPSKVKVLLVGTGVVGKSFLEIARGPLPKPIEIVGVANSRGFVDDVSRVGELLSRPSSGAPFRISDDVLDRFEGVIVDATASEEITELYARALARGITVVTANKKPLAGDLETRNTLFALPGTLRYSATVGAGLPIIETLKNLVSTGDQVKRIDCVLSGTVGFLCNEITAGVPFSKAFATARERGYTEPDPWEDLGGKDVARKAVILARELGAPFNVEDVELEAFAAHAEDPSKHDAAFAARATQLARRKEKLVYLARIERDSAGLVRATAGPIAVPLAHPAARLEGASSLAAFTTSRYPREPLVVSGSGAGGPVTAAAVLGDILACQNTP